MKYNEILEFWFDEIDESSWFKKDLNFDKNLRDRFSDIHRQAVQCELFEWRESSQGCLAEVIILDQFSRNIYRDTPAAFTADSQALVLAQEAVRTKKDKALTPEERTFLYMPFMHSESIKVHDVALVLFQENGIQSNIEYEVKHREIIKRFGRYPHRNKILGRPSTPDELIFLDQPGSSF